MKRLKITFVFVCMIFGAIESKAQESKIPLNFNNGEIAKENLKKYVTALINSNIEVFNKTGDKKIVECKSKNIDRFINPKLQMAYWSNVLTKYKQNCYKPNIIGLPLKGELLSKLNNHSN